MRISNRNLEIPFIKKINFKSIIYHIFIISRDKKIPIIINIFREIIRIPSLITSTTVENTSYISLQISNI